MILNFLPCSLHLTAMLGPTFPGRGRAVLFTSNVRRLVIDIRWLQRASMVTNGPRACCCRSSGWHVAEPAPRATWGRWNKQQRLKMSCSWFLSGWRWLWQVSEFQDGFTVSQWIVDYLTVSLISSKYPLQVWRYVLSFIPWRGSKKKAQPLIRKLRCDDHLRCKDCQCLDVAPMYALYIYI